MYVLQYSLNARPVPEGMGEEEAPNWPAILRAVRGPFDSVKGTNVPCVFVGETPDNAENAVHHGGRTVAKFTVQYNDAGNPFADLPEAENIRSVWQDYQNHRTTMLTTHPILREEAAAARALVQRFIQQYPAGGAAGALQATIAEYFVVHVMVVAVDHFIVDEEAEGPAEGEGEGDA